MQINQISNAPMQKNQAPQQNFKGSAAFRLPMNKLKLGPEIVGEAKALARSTVACGCRSCKNRNNRRIICYNTFRTARNPQVVGNGHRVASNTGSERLPDVTGIPGLEIW